MNHDVGFLSRHLWWVVLLAVDVFAISLIPAWSYADEVLRGLLIFIAIVNVYMLFVILLNKPRAGKFSVRSQEFDAWDEWLSTGLLVVFVGFALHSSTSFSLELLWACWMFWSTVEFLVALRLGWVDEEGAVVTDERGEKIKKDSARVAYTTLSIAVLLSPFILGLGDGAERPVRPSTMWFFGYFVNCILFASWIGKTYVVSRFVGDRLTTWKWR